MGNRAALAGHSISNPAGERRAAHALLGTDARTWKNGCGGGEAERPEPDQTIIGCLRCLWATYATSTQNPVEMHIDKTDPLC